MDTPKRTRLLFSKFLTSASLQIKPTTVKLLLAFIIFIFKTLLLKFYVRITPTRRRREKARDGPYYFQGYLVVFETGAAAPKNNEKNVETSPLGVPLTVAACGKFAK